MSPATDADWPEIFRMDARAFALPAPLPDEEQIEFRAKFPDDATYVVRDADRIVAFSMYFVLPMTVPGGREVATAGLSWVSVAATHRRRGLLRRMLDTQFADWRAAGHSLAILTASEATIYERFGFGPAVFAHSVHIDPSTAAFRTPAPDDSRVRYATADEVSTRLPDIHARWAATRPGAIGRPDAWWPSIVADRGFRRNSQTSGLHYLLHDDGYASYRIDAREHTATVDDFVAVTDQAHDDLWRVLTALDLITSVHVDLPVDDSLPHALTDVRAVAVKGLSDVLWVSILDVADALASRVYGADGVIVLEVGDAYSDRAGRYELRVSDGDAAITRTDAPTDVTLDIAVLSSLYLGGVAARDLATAGRITGDAEAVRLLDAMFRASRAPFSGTYF